MISRFTPATIAPAAALATKARYGLTVSYSTSRTVCSPWASRSFASGGTMTSRSAAPLRSSSRPWAGSCVIPAIVIRSPAMEAKLPGSVGSPIPGGITSSARRGGWPT